jgi:hypothetical protein
MDEKFLKKLLATMKCSMCGHPYQSGNVNILGHKDDLWFLSVFCPSCKSQGLVAAVVKEGKVTEVLTELTAAEQKRLASAAPLSSDDLMDMHRFLADFDGDFQSLFAT